jgi:hypothetical protein
LDIIQVDEFGSLFNLNSVDLPRPRTIAFQLEVSNVIGGFRCVETPAISSIIELTRTTLLDILWECHSVTPPCNAGGEESSHEYYRNSRNLDPLGILVPLSKIDVHCLYLSTNPELN